MIVIEEGLAPGIAAIAIAVAEGLARIVLAIAEGHFEHAGGQEVLAEDFGLGGAGSEAGDDGIIIGREIGTVGSQDVLPECLDIREQHGRAGKNRTDGHIFLQPPVFPGNPVAWAVQVPVAGLHRPGVLAIGLAERSIPHGKAFDERIGRVLVQIAAMVLVSALDLSDPVTAGQPFLGGGKIRGRFEKMAKLMQGGKPAMVIKLAVLPFEADCVQI